MEWALIALIGMLIGGFIALVVWIVKRQDSQSERLFAFVHQQLDQNSRAQEQSARTLSETVANTAKAVSREIYGEREEVAQPLMDPKALQIMRSVYEDDLPEPGFDPAVPFDETEEGPNVAYGPMAWGPDTLTGLSVPKTVGE